MACNFKPYEGEEKYIFVSYAHEDGKTVYPILERMNEAGYRIWYDEGIEWGTEFNEYIATRIDKCDVVIAFHSKASNRSDYCKREVNYAINNVKKKILSIYLEEVKLSSGMVMQLSSYQSTFWHQYEDKGKFFDRLMNDTPILADCKENNAEEKHKGSERESAETLNIRDIDEKSRKDNDEMWMVRYFELYIDQSEKFEISGDAFEREGNYLEARNQYEESAKKLEELIGAVGEVGSREQLSSIYRRLSVSYKKIGDLCKPDEVKENEVVSDSEKHYNIWRELFK